MALTFPSSPTTGQVAQVNGRQYQWDGYAWTLVNNISTHAATHASGGSDVLSLDGSQITTGTIADARRSSKAQAATNLYLWSTLR